MGKESDCNAEPEEGEIIDDDDLEAISDDSITPGIGKLNSNKESLCALSLSSVSEGEVAEENAIASLNNIKRKLDRKPGSRKKRRLSRHYHRRSRSNNSSSSDDDEKISLTKKLLKEAIRIDSSRTHNNSLRTRLKGMVTETPIENSEEVQIEASVSDNVEDNDIPCPSLNVVGDNKISSEDTIIIDVDKESRCSSVDIIDDDNELIQLRLEALKTAMINKYHHRKQRKIQDVNNLEVNKENSCDNYSNSVNSLTSSTNFSRDNVENSDHVNNSVNNSEEDEDEDILRAILLASISKKITNKISTPSTPNMKKAVNNVKNAISTRSRFKNKNKPTPKPFAAPKIERFIISVNNSDSDSDDNVTESKDGQTLEKDEEKDVEKQVEQFLKKQRAEVEAKRKIINNQQQQIVKNAEEDVTTKCIRTNDLYKLLPKNKQIEYEKLIQKLKIATEKKPKESTSTKNENKILVQTNKPKITTKTDITNNLINVNNKTVSIINKGTSLEKLSESAIEAKIVNIKTPKSKVSSVSECNNIGSAEKRQLRGAFQSSLKEVQIQKNGSFQIRGKYTALSSLLQKMNESSNRQKRHQLRIKSLLSQLRDARNDYQKSQDDFHLLLKEFFKKKEEIDKRQFRRVQQVNKDVNNDKRINVRSLPQKTKQPDDVKDRKEEVRCKVVLEKCPVDLTDPNDIEFKTLDGNDVLSVPKYISPLDSKAGVSNMNPLGILCPFEMNGSCRDKECSFNHYNKETS